jgi:hypothetical protein
MAWAIAVPVGVYGLISLSAFVAVLTRPPDAPRGGMYIPMLLLGIGAVYGAAATLQDEFAAIKSWRPSWSQGFGLAWFGGWTIVIIEWLIADLRTGGLTELRQSIGPVLAVFGLFVALPWILTSIRRRSRQARI